MAERCAGDCADRADITDLLHRYAEVIDGRRWSALDAVFAADAVVDYGSLGGVHTGPGAVGSYCAGVLETYAATQHLIGNVVVRPGGDTATSSCSFSAVHVYDDGRPPLLVGGRYDDELARSDAGWRIARRRLIPVWASGPTPGSLGPA